MSGIFRRLTRLLGKSCHAVPRYRRVLVSALFSVVAIGISARAEDDVAPQSLEVAIQCMKPAKDLLASVPASGLKADWSPDAIGNDEIAAVAADPLGSQAYRVSSVKMESEVWARKLSDGSTLLALINLTDEERDVKVRVDDLGIAGTLRDLWRKKNIAVMIWADGTRVKPHGAALCKVIPFSTYTEAVREDVPGPDYTPEEVCRCFSKDLLSRQATQNPHYAEICTAVGALRAAKALEDQPLADALIERYREFHGVSSPFDNLRRHVDISVRGSLPLEMYRMTKDQGYLDAGLKYADRQWENPRADGLSGQTRWWIDDIYMIGMLQTQAYRATGDIKYAERAARTMIAYSKKLQRPNGLFFHGPKYPHFWGRGNGWVAVGMAEVLRGLPESSELNPALLAYYQKMMAALKQHQADSGMWRQLIDQPESYEETSCTGMFGYAILLGVRSGNLDAATYQPVIDKAWEGLTRYLNPDGTVREVCMGTGQDEDARYYLDRPRIIGDYHGQAPVLWFASELLEQSKGK